MAFQSSSVSIVLNIFFFHWYCHVSAGTHTIIFVYVFIVYFDRLLGCLPVVRFVFSLYIMPCHWCSPSILRTYDRHVYPRAVSTLHPHVQIFFLKMITRQKDGTTAALTSVQCAAGSSQEICMVEVLYSSNKRESSSTSCLKMKLKKTPRISK